jgi:hypothetical protein
MRVAPSVASCYSYHSRNAADSHPLVIQATETLPCNFGLSSTEPQHRNSLTFSKKTGPNIDTAKPKTGARCRGYTCLHAEVWDHSDAKE